MGGFTEGGVMAWSEEVAGRLQDFGGELVLRSQVEAIELDGNRVPRGKADDRG